MGSVPWGSKRRSVASFTSGRCPIPGALDAGLVLYLSHLIPARQPHRHAARYLSRNQTMGEGSKNDLSDNRMRYLKFHHEESDIAPTKGFMSNRVEKGNAIWRCPPREPLTAHQQAPSVVLLRPISAGFYHWSGAADVM